MAELERVLARAPAWSTSGRPGQRPLAGRPGYDPLWARLNEARVPVAFHINDTRYAELWSVQWGEQPPPPCACRPGSGPRPRRPADHGDAGGLLLYNLFGRFPDLRVRTIENGSDWVPGLLQGLDTAGKLGRQVIVSAGTPRTAGGVFLLHIWVSPYPEEDPVPLSELIGADQVLIGSDWPHSEGIAEPAEFAGKLTALGADGTRQASCGPTSLSCWASPAEPGSRPEPADKGSADLVPLAIPEFISAPE